jgi:hypothetical protein
MGDKPVSATSGLQARAFDPARRSVIPANLTGRNWLVDGKILARLGDFSQLTCKYNNRRGINYPPNNLSHMP